MARTRPWRRRAETTVTQEVPGPHSSEPTEPAGAGLTGPEAQPEPGEATDSEPTLDASPVDSADDPTEPTGVEPAKAEPAHPADTFRPGDLTAVLLVRAAHPRQVLLTAIAMAVAAVISGRPTREVVLVGLTVLVGQTGLGWFNDLVDRRRDVHHQRAKPLVDGRLDTSTLWFALAIALFLVVPMSVGSGVHAGTAYLVSLGVAVVATGWLGLRRAFFSWVPWVISFGLYPAFLSYGGWGGQHHGSAPTVLMTVLAALLGLGVHVLTSLWGLVPDNADSWTYLPLRLGQRLGTPRLLGLTLAYCALVLAVIAVAGATQGLSQPPLS